MHENKKIPSYMKIHDFIKKRKYLVWHTQSYNKLNEAAIVEATLNYGDWDDVQKLIKILGIKKMARIFYRQIKQKKCNYSPRIKNFFNKYFNKYAS